MCNINKSIFAEMISLSEHSHFLKCTTRRSHRMSDDRIHGIIIQYLQIRHLEKAAKCKNIITENHKCTNDQLASKRSNIRILCRMEFFCTIVKISRRDNLELLQFMPYVGMHMSTGFFTLLTMLPYL